MIQIIAGEKGKGKTKILIDKANSEVLTAKGSIVYIDKNNKHMYELCNKIRLINIKDYYIENAKEFVGFISGLISQDHDLTIVYLDNILSITNTKLTELPVVIDKLETLSSVFGVSFIISVTASAEALPEELKSKVSVAL